MRRIDLPSCPLECSLVSDGRGGVPTDVVFEDVAPAELTDALRSYPSPPDAPYNCLLVRAPDALVLVDTGLGAAEHPFGGFGGELWSELSALGVEPADVGVVVISHGHLDHIGGLTIDGAPAFPRARYVMSEGEWRYWTSESALAERSELAAAPAREHLPALEAAGVVDLITGEAEVAAGVRVLPAPGHTPAHLAVEVGDAGGLLYMVDALLHPLQVERPEWGRGLDLDGDTSVATRRALLERGSERGHSLAASHWDVVLERR